MLLRKIILRLLKPLAALFLLAALASCEPPHDVAEEPPVAVGTVAFVKIFGHHYRGEVTSVHDGYVVWSYTWKKTPVFKFKTYRGLLDVYSEEEGYKSYSKFDHNILDEFFPIEVGKETTLQGKKVSEKAGIEYPFWATILVREKTMIKIKETEYPVFVIDFSIIEEHPDGAKNYIRTIWYSEIMETSLRTDYVMGNEIISIRVVSLNGPDELDDLDENEPEGLGTVRL